VAAGRVSPAAVRDGGAYRVGDSGSAMQD